MKYVPATESDTGLPTIELTRRNLTILLAKLDDPLSKRTITKDGHAVHATEDHTIWDDPETPEWAVVAVEDEAHYSDRSPGSMYMPSTGETI